MNRVKKPNRKFKAIVIGTSAGGLDALARILPDLPADFPVPVLVVQHISASSDSYLIEYLNNMSLIRIKEAEDKEPLLPGIVYFAPPDYHLMAEEDATVSLSNSEKVNYSRPSIDVLFETASWVFRDKLIAVIMTGANWDGAKGMKVISEAGGYTLVENPETAAVPRMPASALDLIIPDRIAALEEIAQILKELVM